MDSLFIQPQIHIFLPHSPPAQVKNETQKHWSFCQISSTFTQKPTSFCLAFPLFLRAKTKTKKNKSYAHKKKRESLIEMSDSRRKKGGMKGEIVRIIFGTNASLI